MTTLLFAAQWIHLTLCVLLAGGFCVLLLAGQPRTALTRQWEQRVLRGACFTVVGALLSGVVVMSAQTASFEARPAASIEPHAILRAVLDTRLGLVWMARQGLLVVLAVFLVLSREAHAGTNWIAARAQAFLLAALALVLIGSSSHLTAMSESAWTQGVAMLHLLGAGVWLGGLPPLALLLYGVSQKAAAPDPYAVRALLGFFRVSLVMVLVLAGSGVASAWLLVGGVVGLVGTTYGLLLLAKLGVLVLALLLATETLAMLPAFASGTGARTPATARRMALFLAIAAALALLLLGLATAMTMATPALHNDPVWPWNVRLSFDAWSEVEVLRRLVQMPVAYVPAVAGLSILIVVFLVRRQPVFAFGSLFALAAVGLAIGLQPSIVQAYPTTFARSPVPYAADSIVEGGALYQAHCASCHGTPKFDGAVQGGTAVDLLVTETAWLSSGDLFWFISHGAPEHGMPAFASQLQDTQRWRVIAYLRALANAGFCASVTSRVSSQVEPGAAWLPAPDATVSVGPLPPTKLRDLRGKRMVLLVLYSLPGSRARMSELAKHYGALSVLGVEVVAVQPRSSPDAIAELGQTPPALFPVVTEGNEDITAAFRMFARGSAHAELLIDRQGYIRAIWRSDQTGDMPETEVIQAQLEKLNEEKTPPPPPDDHIH
jgi:putative copper export protein/mono/diheme cytochrome c family protein/peroxiredoxin